MGETVRKRFFWKMDVRANLVMSVCSIRQQGLFSSVYVDDNKKAGKNQNLEPTWKRFMHKIDLEETHYVSSSSVCGL